ncbi:hypothetical protein FBU30_007372 [Linnemannia zychae]|nr:hypothetical protein FBU30_007372 [Linnemannia zychae]
MKFSSGFLSVTSSVALIGLFAIVGGRFHFVAAAPVKDISSTAVENPHAIVLPSSGPSTEPFTLEDQSSIHDLTEKRGDKGEEETVANVDLSKRREAPYYWWFTGQPIQHQ